MFTHTLLLLRSLRRSPPASSRGYAVEEALRTIPFSWIHRAIRKPVLEILSHTNGFSILRGPHQDAPLLHGTNLEIRGEYRALSFDDTRTSVDFG